MDEKAHEFSLSISIFNSFSKKANFKISTFALYCLGVGGGNYSMCVGRKVTILFMGDIVINNNKGIKYIYSLVFT